MDLKGPLSSGLKTFKNIDALKIIRQPSCSIHFSEYIYNKMLEILKAVELTFQEEVQTMVQALEERKPEKTSLLSYPSFIVTKQPGVWKLKKSASGQSFCCIVSPVPSLGERRQYRGLVTSREKGESTCPLRELNMCPSKLNGPCAQIQKI